MSLVCSPHVHVFCTAGGKQENMRPKHSCTSRSSFETLAGQQPRPESEPADQQTSKNGAELKRRGDDESGMENENVSDADGHLSPAERKVR